MKSRRKIWKPAWRKTAAWVPEGCSSSCDSMRSTCGELSSSLKADAEQRLFDFVSGTLRGRCGGCSGCEPAEQRHRR